MLDEECLVIYWGQVWCLQMEPGKIYEGFTDASWHKVRGREIGIDYVKVARCNAACLGRRLDSFRAVWAVKTLPRVFGSDYYTCLFRSHLIATVVFIWMWFFWLWTSHRAWILDKDVHTVQVNVDEALGINVSFYSITCGSVVQGWDQKAITPPSPMAITSPPCQSRRHHTCQHKQEKNTQCDGLSSDEC